MLTRTGFPEFLESIAIGPGPEFLRTQTDYCDAADEFPTEINATYLWKKINVSVDPLTELREFTKHFLVDAPDFSEEFILHFVKKVNMLPPDLKDQILYEVEDALDKAAKIVPKGTYDPTKDDIAKRNFDRARAVNDDPSLLDKLSNMMDSCKSSCNYFSPVTDKVGSIFDFSRMNSLNSSMPHDTELNAPPPTGLGLNIMNKIPRGIQDTMMQAYTSAKLLMDAAKEQLTSPGTTAKLREFAKQGVSADRKGVPFIGSTGSSLFQDALGLNSSLMTKVKRNMGDCFRIADFMNRYNAFDEDMNLAVARKKVFKIQIPDASLGGEKRTWSGTAQGVSTGDAEGSDPYSNNTTPQFALKPQTTGEARNYDDAVSTRIPCPGDTPIGQSPATASSQSAASTAAAATAAVYPPREYKQNSSQLSNDRVDRFKNELNDPAVLDRIEYLAKREGGKSGDLILETAANRAMFTNKSLKEVLYNEAYYGPGSATKPHTAYTTDIIQKVIYEGQNRTGLATDNAYNDRNLFAKKFIDAGASGNWFDLKTGQKITDPARIQRLSTTPGDGSVEYIYQKSGSGSNASSTAGKNAKKYGERYGV